MNAPIRDQVAGMPTQAYGIISCIFKALNMHIDRAVDKWVLPTS